MRDIIDNVDRENFRPIFKDFLERLQRGKHLSGYQLFPNLYLAAMDGSQYFCSEKIQCPACLEKKHKNGTVTYSHQILKISLMHPYYIEHNYGHGGKNLSFIFLLLTLLAFYFHQIFELTDPIFQECQKRSGSKINLWNKLRAFIEHLLFESWHQLLEFILNRNKPWAISKPP